MSEERVEILKMVADKIISVDEAERLLRALDDGAQQRAEQQAGPKAGSPWSKGLGTIGEALAGIGPVVKDAMESIVGGFGYDTGDDADDLERLELVDGRLPIDADTELVVRNDRKLVAGPGRLEIVGTDDDHGEILAGDAGNLRVFARKNRLIVRWTDGPLRLRVPHRLRRLKAVSLGGDISVRQIDAELTLKTMGGNLDLDRLRQAFSVKTMGGNVRLDLDPAWQGDSQVATMGGNVTVRLPATANVTVEAATFGGMLKVDRRLGDSPVPDYSPSLKTTLTVGTGPQRATLSVKTMGGDINLEGSEA